MLQNLPSLLTKNKEHGSDENLVEEGRAQENDSILGYQPPVVVSEQPVLETVRHNEPSQERENETASTSSGERVIFHMPKIVNTAWNMFPEE